MRPFWPAARKRWRVLETVLMKLHFIAKTLGKFASIVTTWLLLFSCAPISQAGYPDAGDAKLVSLQQKKADLLAGLPQGICYSGFRHGQHPDRGGGAANPSEQQILEDLHILTLAGTFKMIRLYDARTNSEVILRLIRENKLKLTLFCFPLFPLSLFHKNKTVPSLDAAAGRGGEDCQEAGEAAEAKGTEREGEGENGGVGGKEKKG